MTFRLLQTGHQSAAFNMALDEVLIHRIARGLSRPSLRFYGWKPAAISIGYFQSLAAEVDTVKCQELGVDIVRRQTGGGAVFHDQEVTYSIHVPLNLGLMPMKILDSYERICRGILEGLRTIGVSASFVPLNDIVIGNKKISGNAQTRREGVLLQHGTILMDVDVDKMFDLLKVPDEKMKGKLISNIKERVTSLSQTLGRPVSFEEIVGALTNGFKTAFPEIDFQEDGLIENEKDEAFSLAKTKYSKKIWNQQR